MPDEINVARVREDTPGCHEVVHLNNAGAALMPRQVLDATVEHLQLEAMIGGYEAADQAEPLIDATYDAVARLIGSAPDEIAVVENATRAFDMAFYAIPFKPGDRILTSVAEYASNVISYYQVAKKTGAVVEVVPNDESGQLSIDALRTMIDERVRLIALSHIPTNGGLVQPVEAIGKVAREAGVLFLLDACQSVGQLPIDVNAIGCDMLSATSRKFLRGPRGVGFLYVRKDLATQLEPPLLDLQAATWTSIDSYEIRPDTRRFENWEANIAGKIGMGVAAEYALEIGVDAGWRRIQSLADSLRARIEVIPGGQVHDLGVNRCGIVSFTIAGHDPDTVMERLAEHRINVRTSTIFSTRFDMTARGVDHLVRASVHYYNTDDELDRMAAVLETMAKHRP
ncbi:MAG TPA: aminotransferase class V-fold PLP-dependent enzyme [Nitrolancea sp.]|nr:aminotransferase class V-fold PLP-dependent enzyme [Nitrolancea sp.]